MREAAAGATANAKEGKEGLGTGEPEPSRVTEIEELVVRNSADSASGSVVRPHRSWPQRPRKLDTCATILGDDVPPGP